MPFSEVVMERAFGEEEGCAVVTAASSDVYSAPGDVHDAGFLTLDAVRGAARAPRPERLSAAGGSGGVRPPRLRMRLKVQFVLAPALQVASGSSEFPWHAAHLCREPLAQPFEG